MSEVHRFTVRCQAEALSGLRLRLAEILRQREGCTPSFSERAQLVLSEALHNAAAGADWEGSLQVEFAFPSDAPLLLSVEGRSAESAEALQELLIRADLPDISSERGRGLFLIREMTTRAQAVSCGDSRVRLELQLGDDEVAS